MYFFSPSSFSDFGHANRPVSFEWNILRRSSRISSLLIDIKLGFSSGNHSRILASVTDVPDFKIISVVGGVRKLL